MAFRMGLMIGFSLIMAIGAQNLFIIRQGIRREYSYYVAVICLLCDSLLIFLSISSVSLLITQYPLVKQSLLWFAVLFLTGYGSFSIYRGIRPGAESTFENTSSSSLSTSYWKITLTALCFSLLNPHAILDTVVLMGGIANNFSSTTEQYHFALGAVIASCIWFFGLTLLSVKMSKLIKTKPVFRGLEIVSGLLMLFIAYKVLVA